MKTTYQCYECEKFFAESELDIREECEPTEFWGATELTISRVLKCPRCKDGDVCEASPCIGCFDRPPEEGEDFCHLCLAE